MCLRRDSRRTEDRPGSTLALFALLSEAREATGDRVCLTLRPAHPGFLQPGVHAEKRPVPLGAMLRRRRVLPARLGTSVPGSREAWGGREGTDGLRTSGICVSCGHGRCRRAWLLSSLAAEAGPSLPRTDGRRRGGPQGLCVTWKWTDLTPLFGAQPSFPNPGARDLVAPKELAHVTW